MKTSVIFFLFTILTVTIYPQTTFSVRGNGWDRQVVKSEAITDTLENSASMLQVLTSTQRSYTRVSVDPRIKNDDLEKFLGSGDSLLSQERSVNYVVPLLSTYKDITVRKTFIQRSGSSSYLVKTSGKTTRAFSYGCFFALAALIPALLVGFALRRLKIGVGKKIIASLGTALVPGISYFVLPLFSIPLLSISPIEQVFPIALVSVVAFFSSSLSSIATGDGKDEMPPSASRLLLLIFGILLFAISLETDSSAPPLILLMLAAFLYFLGYFLARLAKKLFPEKLGTANIKLFV